MSELTDEALTFRVHAMSLSARVVETAISLAKDAGEPVERPLTDAQLKRAFDVHVAEDLILTRLLIDHAEFMALPESTRAELTASRLWHERFELERLARTRRLKRLERDL
jgi:uncharacterized protein YpbB